jgi:hypothetical protein
LPAAIYRWQTALFGEIARITRRAPRASHEPEENKDDDARLRVLLVEALAQSSIIEKRQRYSSITTRLGQSDNLKKRRKNNENTYEREYLVKQGINRLSNC